MTHSGCLKIFGEGKRERGKEGGEKKWEEGEQKAWQYSESINTPALLLPKRWFRPEIRSQVSSLVAQNGVC